MEILIMAPTDSARAARFQQFLRDNENQPAAMAPGARVPAARSCLRGAVLFADAQAPVTNQAFSAQESLRFLSVPLIVVSPEAPSEAVQAPIRTAGAATVLGVDAADAAILEEIASRSPVRPVPRDTYEHLVAPLLTAVRQTLKQMADTEVAVQSSYECAAPVRLGDLRVTLSLSHTLEGLLIMSFSLRTAEALWRKIVAEENQAIDPSMIGDCMGEIANIVAGQAKALLAGTAYHFVFSTPIVTLSHQPGAFKEGMNSLVLACECDQGPFALQISRP